MKKVLFICTGNTCRSPMAEYVFNTLCAHKGVDASADSAGLCTVTGLPMSENSLRVLSMQGISAEDFTSTSIEDVNLRGYDVFAVMTREHSDILAQYGVPAERIHILAQGTGGISDPYGGSIGRYRQCYDEISEAVNELILLMEDRL